MMLRLLQYLLVLSAALALSACATLTDLSNRYYGGHIQRIQNAEVQKYLLNENLKELPSLAQQPIITVYSFTDLTGQRKPDATLSLFSTAVTQAPEVFLIRALRNAGNGKIFRVVERKGIDHVLRERQLIRSARDTFDGEGENQLPPLLFAGLIIEGGVVGYDTSIQAGGSGARYLGIGSSTRYVKDTVTISIRLISVATGEVLLDVISTKTILAVGISQDIFRFIEMGTELIEVENGTVENESVSIATQKAVEAAVYELILKGERSGYWEFSEN